MKKSKLMKKKFQKFFSLSISLRVTLKLSLRSSFSAKKHFFVSCRKFIFNLEKLSKHYSQLKKQVKVDLETTSYDFLTKTREKNPMLPNIRKLEVTLGLRMNLDKDCENPWRTFCKLLKMIWISPLHQIWPTSTIYLFRIISYPPATSKESVIFL